ncbi:GNAT family N-acetyltransferase [Streptomyces orinoci]|uniref:GNAT family N-acetyltransferase n=1 Tax=Streptomyces orinoci TaxID=67339 RepID=A0ABV3JVP4_STRON|nr:GNAT family N-acetyltransferase [Streptomyces orinoci]
MSQLTVRAATLADEAALAEMDRRCWSPRHAVGPRPEAPYPPFFGEGDRPERVLVGEVAGTVAGYARFTTPVPVPSNAHVRQIQGLLVDNRFRGLGLARSLLGAVVAEARREGARRLTLRVLGGNTAARRLYETEGFVQEGLLPGEFFLDGEYVDDVLMGRALVP